MLGQMMCPNFTEPLNTMTLLKTDVPLAALPQSGQFVTPVTPFTAISPN